MRQVPHYLIIGNGRVATHFKHYFSLLNLNFSTWSRVESIDFLHKRVLQATHILLLISDSAIDTFIKENLSTTAAYLIHFSGSLVTEFAYGTHPLYTFSQQLYQLEQYSHIPFVVDEDAPGFAELLPGLANPYVYIPKQLKPKYHALCVLSGNFSCMLWQKFFHTFNSEFKIPHAVAFPYFWQQMQNLSHDYHSALTGPLVRDDKKTLADNLKALDADPFQDVYQSFISCYQRLNEK